MDSFEEQNMKFLQGDFRNFTIPKEHKFLYKYFKNKLQKSFLEYCYVMSSENAYFFQDHTGNKITNSFVYKLVQKIKALLYLYEKAKNEIDFDTLKKLERGQFYIKEILYLKEKNVDKI